MELVGFASDYFEIRHGNFPWLIDNRKVNRHIFDGVLGGFKRDEDVLSFVLRRHDPLGIPFYGGSLHSILSDN